MGIKLVVPLPVIVAAGAEEGGASVLSSCAAAGNAANAKADNMSTAIAIPSPSPKI